MGVKVDEVSLLIADRTLHPVDGSGLNIQIPLQSTSSLKR